MDLSKMITESRNENSTNLDLMNAMEICQVMNNEDKKVPLAISKELDNISAVVEMVAKAFENGNRLFYLGAGTSGRLGVLDASECPPTFGVPKGQVIGLIAGGDYALRNAVEKAEDNERYGSDDLKTYNLSSGDVVVGIAASGRTPYVIGGLKYANKIGCKTASISCNKNSEIGKVSDIAIEVIVGPEVLTGSSRLKAGTSQKLICNMITTGAMILNGKSYYNLMVDVVQSNEKLNVRAENIVMEATGVDRKYAREVINKADGVVKIAIVMIVLDCDKDEAVARLTEAKGHTRKAIIK